MEFRVAKTRLHQDKTTRFLWEQLEFKSTSQERFQVQITSQFQLDQLGQLFYVQKT